MATASTSKATSKDDELRALEDTTNSTLVLLQKFNAALESSTTTSQPWAADSPEPLDVIHTSAKLLKAHTTKLSLLIINKPFTPSAIRKIIGEVASTCLPALVSAVSLCPPERYGKAVHDEVKARVRLAFKELESLFHEVLAQGTSAASEHGSGSSGKSSKRTKPKVPAREVLPSTGVAWEAWDSLMELKNSSIAGILVHKAQQYHDTLKDAIEELKEWGEADKEEQDDDDNEGEDAFEGSDGGNSIERMLGAMQTLPRDRPDLRTALDKSVKKLRLVSSLYQAVIKRRLRPIQLCIFASTPAAATETAATTAIVTRLDRVMDKLRAVPDEVDELASAFYELDETEVQRSLALVCATAKDIVNSSSKDWAGTDDAYTQWTQKWDQAIDQDAPV